MSRNVSRPRRLLPWLTMGLLVLTALLISTQGDSGPPTTAERVTRIASEVRCPTCRQLSAAESDAPAAEAVRVAIAERVERGESDAAIRAFLVSRYGSDILLRPGNSGVAALVWVLPVAGFVCALAGLAYAFHRWRRTDVDLTEADRALVAQALTHQDGA